MRLRPPLPLARRLAALALAAALLPGCHAGGPGSPAGPPGPGEPATLLTTPAEKSGEAVYRREIDERFAALDRIVIAQLESDVYGVARLERISAQIFG